MHPQSKEAVLKCFSEGPKVAKKQKQTDGNNGKASNATPKRSLKESFAAAGPKFTQATGICESKVCNKIIRGGVEDTRLEAKAKAKDTKKIRGQGQGQGQPFRGQTLSRPRTGMLEAKAKDQGHKAQVLSKKKKKKSSSQKFFRRSPKKKKKKKKKKKVFTKFFKRSPRKNAFQKIFQPLHKILTFQKIVLSSSRGQANFRGLEASRPRPRTSKSVLEDVLKAKDVLEDSTSENNDFLQTNYR